MADQTHASFDSAAARLVAARAGSSEALGQLMAGCRNYLLLVANSALGENLRAKVGPSDLVQETFVEAQRILGRFNGATEQEFLAWLVRILENKLGNTIKRYQWSAKRNVAREWPMGAGDISSQAQLPLAAQNESPSQQMIRQEQGQRLEVAILALSEEHRRAIELRIWQELPFDEVGRLMNRSADAARKLVARAIDQLQLQLVTNDDDSRSARF